MDSQETQNLNSSSLSTTFREQISLPRSDRVNLSPLSPLRISPPRLSPLSPLRISPDRPPITISPPILVISDDEGSLSGFSVRSLGMESSLTFNYDSNMEELPHNSNNFSSRFRSASNYLNDENRTTPTQSNAYEVNEDDTTDEDEIVPDSVDRLHDHDSPERRNEETEQDDSDNGDDFLPNSIPDLQQSSNQIFDNQNSESLDSEDHLFAPEEPPEINNTLSRNMIPPSGIPHRYFSCLTPSLLPVGTRYYNSRSGNWLVPRTSYRSRYSTSSSLGLGSNTASSSASDCPLNLTSSRRLPAYWLNRSRLLSLRNRTRSTYERLFHPFNTTPASEVTNSAMENGNLNDVSNDLMYRIRRHPRFLSEDDESENAGNPSSNTPYRPPDTLQSSRPHRSDSMDNFSLLQSLFNIPEIAIRSPVVSTVGSCARARSVSPGVPSSWFGLGGSDEALDDSLVDIRNRDDRSRHSSSMHADFVRFVNGNHNDAQIERPNTPLPPPVSDDESTIARNCTNSSQPATVITSTAAVEAASSNSTKPPGLKEIPQTYEEMNHELIQLLECPICFEYATPPINQCLQGHIICTNCRKRVNSCPTCRNMFQESRNLIMEKVAALLRYPCKNAITGCPETLFLLQKEQHERSCGFRHYLCFVPTCNWRGYKPELLVHVQETHENHVIIGGSVNLLIPITGQTKKVWLMSAFNELFYVIFFATLGILKGCVRFIGDSSKSDNYTYTISVTSDEEMLRNLNYTRTTHAYEETNENFDILDSYDLFSISYQSLSTFRRGTRAPVRVTVEEVPNRSRTTT